MKGTIMAQENKFEIALSKFIKATKGSMDAAKECAQLSLEHFAAHGDLSQCQKFLDNMPKNYIRRAAYVKWLMAFAPVTLDGAKLVKDKSEEAVDLDLDKALAKPFWEFAPAAEDIIFTDADVLTAIERTLKKFESGERYKAANDNAVSTVSAIREVLANLPIEAMAKA